MQRPHNVLPSIKNHLESLPKRRGRGSSESEPSVRAGAGGEVKRAEWACFPKSILICLQIPSVIASLPSGLRAPTLCTSPEPQFFRRELSLVAIRVLLSPCSHHWLTLATLVCSRLQMLRAHTRESWIDYPCLCIVRMEGGRESGAGGAWGRVSNHTHTRTKC